MLLPIRDCHFHESSYHSVSKHRVTLRHFTARWVYVYIDMSKPVSALDRISIQETQTFNYGDSRRDSRVMGPRVLDTGLSPPSEVCAKNRSSTFKTSDADDVILQHPAARALQVIGKPSDDIINALRHLHQAGEPISVERLLELVTRTTTDSAIASLLEENKRLKMKRSCKVCLRADVQTLFLPCRHIVCCEKCTLSVVHCPVCERFILATKETYLS